MSLSTKKAQASLKQKYNWKIQLSFAFIGILTIGFLMHLVLVPLVFALKSDFVYRADVLSIDNFYDESTGLFSGEARSITVFEYEALGVERGVAHLRNLFDVRTIGGQEVVSIVRDYAINRWTWKHDPQGGDAPRSGYLFGPRFARKGAPISYWHTNYNKEIQLSFRREEKIHGVPVYKYVSSFGVDQTNNLAHLSGVPDERGINLDVSLSLWIEPVSGWLVKYEDHAIAYYYDQANKKRLHPWNKFSNRYRSSSISEQAHIAASKRNTILSLVFVLPFLIVGFSAALFQFRHSRRNSLRILVGTLGIGVIASALLMLPQALSKPETVTIGILPWVSDGNSVFESNIAGFKSALKNAGFEEGVNIEYIQRSANANPETQRAIIESLIEEDVDLLYSLTTTGTLIAQDRVEHRPIVFSIVTYPVEAGLIHSLGQSKNNLVGTRNWFPLNLQLNAFLQVVPDPRVIGFLHRTGEVNSGIQLAEMRKAASQRGIEIVSISGATLEELTKGLDNKITSVDALYSACDTLIQSHAEETIIARALKAQIPSFSCNSSGPEKGDLLGVVADYKGIGRLAGEKASLIIEGVPPTALETGNVSVPDIVINRDTARALGIVLPQEVIAAATRIIEQ